MHNDLSSLTYFLFFGQNMYEMRLKETLIGNGHIGNKMRSWLVFFIKYL